MTELRCWRGSSGVFGLEGAPVLELVIRGVELDVLKGINPAHHFIMCLLF